ncbi:hypothetical protein PG988_008607 [Apiospora saccharicola]
MEASTISKDTLVPDVPEIPPPPTQVRELVLDDRYADPPMQIPEPGPTELEAENRAVIRVAIWRAEVNAAAAASSLEETPNCACSFLTYRDPPTRWCPNCSTPFEGLEYRQFEAGRGLTRQESGRNSIANVWPVQTPLEGTHGHRHRQPPRGTSHVFSINEFAILGRKLVHRTKLDRVFSSSSKRERKPYAKLEYGDMPGSVAELHPVNDPPGNPSVLIGPNAPFYDPLLDETPSCTATPLEDIRCSSYLSRPGARPDDSNPGYNKYTRNLRARGRFRVRTIKQTMEQPATLGLYRSNDSAPTVWDDLVV